MSLIELHQMQADPAYIADMAAIAREQETEERAHIEDYLRTSRPASGPASELHSCLGCGYLVRHANSYCYDCLN